MAIEKYVTKCIVLDAYEQGEHDKAFKVFTREYGLLICQAKSIRKLESKLRSHILPRSVSLITLVQGKEVWRLVGAENDPVISPYIHEVTALLRRFVRGEGAHKALYDRIISLLVSEEKYDEQAIRILLYFIVLVELGYADAKVIGVKDIKEYINYSIGDLYTHFLLHKASVRKHVREVLQEMQM